MPTCKVVTNGGLHLAVECHGFQLVAETGFVVLKKREVVAEQQVERTVAIFFHPDSVILPDQSQQSDGASGSFVE